MNKKLFLLGIALLIVGFLAALSSVNTSDFLSGPVQSIRLAPNSILYSSVNLNMTSLLSIVYTSGNAPINFYLMNSTAFSEVSPYISTGSIPPNVIENLTSQGMLAYYPNSSSGVYPTSNTTELLPTGSYYLVYQNPGANYVNTTYRYIIPNAALFNSTSSVYKNIFISGIVGASLFIGGIVIMVLSFFIRKEPAQTPAEREAEIAGIYKQLEENEKAKLSRKKARKQKHYKKAKR